MDNSWREEGSLLLAFPVRHRTQRAETVQAAMEGEGLPRKRRRAFPPPPARHRPPAALPTPEAEDDLAFAFDLSDFDCARNLAEEEFPFAPFGVPRAALRSQVYAILEDQTLVDKEFEATRQRNDTIVVSLPTLMDVALVAAPAFSTALAAACGSEEPHVSAVACGLVAHYPEYFRLEDAEDQCARAAVAASSAPKVLAALMRKGFLTKPSQSTSYQWSLPKLGLMVREIVQARKLALSLVKRQPLKEMEVGALAKQMAKRTQSKVSLAFPFIERDLRGSGILQKRVRGLSRTLAIVDVETSELRVQRSVPAGAT